MDIKLIKVDVDHKTWSVLPQQIEKYITSQTIAIVGSTPQFAHGTLDPIKDLSQLAIKYDIGLHVDCCLGSFMLPLLDKIGYHVPPFDFQLDGVTSISCDTHKYGFANKGTSVLMFKNKEYRKNAVKSTRSNIFMTELLYNYNYTKKNSIFVIVIVRWECIQLQHVWEVDLVD